MPALAEIQMNNFRSLVEEELADYRDDFNFENVVQNHLDISRFGPWIDQLSKFHPISGSHVFSSGCGSAGDLYTFMEWGAAAATGIEVDESLARLAKARFQATPFEELVSIQTYDGNILPLPSNSFDIVFSMHVIEHTKNVGLYLAELYRVVKPGGIIFLELPNRYYPIEQHTDIKYIHFLPRRIRDVLIALLCSALNPYRLGEELKYKISSLSDYHIPTPAGIMRSIDALAERYNLELETAVFHSYDGVELAYNQCSWRSYFGGPEREKTTFRVVIRKKST